ncbi:MAG: hypothetical protein ACTHJT_04340 [Cytophaga sp.]|uniref:hypothetical protein n=1 Tax=Cytophaga sp. TaxID=29535 RepID=UPI003F80AA6E
MMRVSANALFVVIIISVLCFIITGALINYSFLYKGHIYTDRTKIQLQHNIDAATTLVLHAPEKDFMNRTEAVDLFADGQDSVHIKANYWGLFTMFSLETFAPHDTLRRAFLKGRDLPQLCRSAIYLQDRDRPLAVSGITKIKGFCYLPGAGAKKTFVEDDSYHGDTIIFGKVERSSRYMPGVDSVCYDYLNKLADGVFPAGMVITELSEYVHNSFFNPTAFININGGGYLNRANIQGNVFLYASGPLTIAASCKLKDVIIVAPSVKIENGFKGNLQVIAWDSVVVQPACELTYPSAIVLLKKKYKDKPVIRIESGALVEGLLISWQDQDDQKRTLVTIEKNATLKGQVLTNGMACIKGTVNGNVTAYSFYYESKTTQYDNLLLGATIDYTALSKHFTGGYFLQTTNQTNRVLKWLQ